MLFLAGELAAKRKARGVKLNYPESIAYIASHLQEAARDVHFVQNNSIQCVQGEYLSQSTT